MINREIRIGIEAPFSGLPICCRIRNPTFVRSQGSITGSLPSAAVKRRHAIRENVELEEESCSDCVPKNIGGEEHQGLSSFAS